MPGRLLQNVPEQGARSGYSGGRVGFVKNYMKIQKIRFGEDVNVSYEADRDALSCHTIKLILQPLAENSIYHGRRDEGVLNINVSISMRENRIVYEVSDDAQ